VDTPTLSWQDDYLAAVEAARSQGKMLLIYFHDRGDQPGPDPFELETLCDPEVAERLAELVRVKAPTDACVRLNGETVVLLNHGSFAEMEGMPGVAMIDFAHHDAPYCSRVVGAFPFLEGRRHTPQQMKVILDLPPGTLTQRTLIYAVRTHPDHPASTEGEIHSELVREAESHSLEQARMRLQGHHRWDTRFRRISGYLPNGLTAKEVCAESWPGEGLLEAAIECVRCWRTSPGHWGAVRTRHDYYGYDLKRGTNGVWYATGIFASRD